MRVIKVTRFGGPEVLVPADAPVPVPGPGEVVVAVEAADTLFVETRIRAGQAAAWFDVSTPYVPGGAVAGTVLSVGGDVDGSWVGRKVAGSTAGDGGYAERAIVPAANLVPIPAGVTVAEAATVTRDGPTALALTDWAKIRPDEWVLILAAAGGAGLLLVQLARQAGARVVAAARGARKLEQVRQVGAEIAVDYSDPDWLRPVRDATGGEGAAVVLDGAGGALGAQGFEVTAPGGRFAAYGAPGGGFAEVDRDEAERRGVAFTGIELVQHTPEQRRERLERMLTEMAAGRITPVIGRTLPLERAADAHAAIESRSVAGKVVLLPQPA